MLTTTGGRDLEKTPEDLGHFIALTSDDNAETAREGDNIA